jgi:hypothetical protein
MHKPPSDRPLSVEDTIKVIKKLEEMGARMKIEAGHPGTKWPGPHLKVCVGGRVTHIPITLP